MSVQKHPLSATEIASLCVTVAALLLVLWLHLLPALLAGLLVYELVHGVAPLLQRRLSSQRARLAAVVVLAALIVGLITATILGALAFFRSDSCAVVAPHGVVFLICGGTRLERRTIQ